MAGGPALISPASAMRLGQPRHPLIDKSVCYTQRMSALDWLLESDPAIRWQVLRDLVHAPADVVAAERVRVAREGWGARLLDLQDEDGLWAGGACFPAEGWQRDQEGQPEGEPPSQPWTSTLPTLQLLHDFGVDPCSE